MLAKLVCFQLEKGRTHTCIRLAINQTEQKLVGVVAAAVEAASLQQTSVSQLLPTTKANRSYLSSSFRLDRQLQADICKCKCRSYSRPALLSKYPSSMLATGRQAHSLTPTSLLPARSVAQNGNQRVDVKQPPLNSWTNGRTDGQTGKCNFSIMIV